MENRMTPTILNLPTELQRLIIACLSFRDLTVCVRVCKTWHDLFMDNIWHTLHCWWGTELQSFNPSMFDSLLSLRDFKATNANKIPDHLNVSDDITRMPEESGALFIRQIHRIRVLKLAYSSLHELFYERMSTTNHDYGDKQVVDLCLEELSIDFAVDPCIIRGKFLHPNACALQSPRPLLQILERSKHLQTLSLSLSSFRAESQDLSRLFAALPSTLERLTVEYPRVTADGQSFVSPILRTFSALKALRIRGPSTDLYFNLVISLLERCPVLEELDAVDDDMYRSTFLDDANLTKILSMGSKGWKTLAVNPGPLSAAVILEHCSTLENLRIPMCSDLPSAFIQKLLCSAPCLKRLDLVSRYFSKDHNVVLMASDIVESSEDWACLDLETFKCRIGGIPRPDIRVRTNSRPLEGILNDPRRYTPQESRAIQRKVLAQFRRLTKLREITLGLSNLYIDSWNHDLFWEEEEAEGEYYQNFDFQQDRQYECLSLSLEDGLDLLKDLKQMRRLRADRMITHKGDAWEQEWIKEHWPYYRKEYKDKFWTSRGLEIPMTEGMEPEVFEIEGSISDNWWIGYDWW